MAIILIENLDNLRVEAKDHSQPLLKHFQAYNLDWMHACGGKGRCTTCKLKVISGLGNFAPRTEAEVRYQRQGALAEDERLACQAKINHDIVVRVPDESKLPHLKYSD
jgi:ferredoxin, 2Fe-2S